MLPPHGAWVTEANTASEIPVRTNHAMHDVLRDDFRKGRIRTFFDLYAMPLAVPVTSAEDHNGNKCVHFFCYPNI